MKYILIALTLSISLTINAQDKEDYFVLEDSEISWKKVYETAKTKEQLITYFEESKIFTAFKVIEDTILAKLKPQGIDTKKTGVAGIPPIVNKCKYKGLVRIELKEKRYRVIFSQLKLVGDGEIIKKNSDQTFEENYLRKGVSEYRPFFLKKPKDVYNYWFNTNFEIETKEKRRLVKVTQWF